MHGVASRTRPHLEGDVLAARQGLTLVNNSCAAPIDLLEDPVTAIAEQGSGSEGGHAVRVPLVDTSNSNQGSGCSGFSSTSGEW